MYPFCVSYDIQNKVPKEAVIIIRGHHHQTQFYFHFDINSLAFVSFAVLFTKNNDASLTSFYEVFFLFSSLVTKVLSFPSLLLDLKFIMIYTSCLFLFLSSVSSKSTDERGRVKINTL